MPDAYLVLLVAGPAGDDHADALRGVARAVPQAGFFDDADEGPQRTVGTFLRAADPADGMALIRAVAGVSRVLQARFEVQHAERVLGFLDAGRPDAALRAELGHLGDIPEPL
jgi:hypothetical protein